MFSHSMFPPVQPTSTPAPVDVSGSGSADHSASGDFSGESGTSSGDASASGDISGSSTSGDVSGSGLEIAYIGHTDTLSGDGSASGAPQEAEGGSTYNSGELGSVSGSGEEIHGGHSGFGVSGSASGAGFASGSGDISGSGELMIIMVDGKMVEVSKPPREPNEQLLDKEGIETIELSTSESMSGSGSGSGSGEFSGITFVDHSAFDLTVQSSGEQYVSGYRPFGSGFHSGFPSGFPSGVSGSGSASGDSFQQHGDVIFVTDDEMIQVSIPPLEIHPQQGRGVVEVSGAGSGSVILHEFNSTLEQSLQNSGSGEATVERLSVALPPGSTMTYSEYIKSLDQSVLGEEEQEHHTIVVTPDTAYTSTITAPSMPLVTPAVVEEPEVAESMRFRCFSIPPLLY